MKNMIKHVYSQSSSELEVTSHETYEKHTTIIEITKYRGNAQRVNY